MHPHLRKAAEDYLIEKMHSCNRQEHIMFKRMYGDNQQDVYVHKIIQAMDDSKLERAMQQVDATIAKKKGDL